MKDISWPLQDINNTPYFIYNLNKVNEKAKFLHQITSGLKCKILYSVKALPLYNVLRELEPQVDGFSVSSLFESQLVKTMCQQKKNIHFVSPGIREDQWGSISNNISYLVFNSLEQISFFEKKLRKDQSYGIRVNPEISFIKDDRYNPCHKFSKLGVPIEQLKENISKDANFFKKISGLHLHTNCESKDLSQLTETFLKIKSHLKDDLKKFQWINLGGGYLFDESDNLSLFHELLNEIEQNYNFTNVIIEPGSFFVGDSGYLVSSVIDIFQRKEKNIAILDTTINHLPEVFEYQYEPDVFGHQKKYKNEYILAGCSCLAGDMFGTYYFQDKLKLGSKIIFKNVGHYSLVKSHTFNGINLPDIYCLKGKSDLKKVKHFTFEEYVSHFGG